MGNVNTKREAYFWHGGIASLLPICVTHPIDLLKVQLQTQVGTKTAKQLISNIYKQQGVSGLYYGLTASLYWSLVFSGVRFGVYDTSKQYFCVDSFHSRALLSIFSGALAGIAGVPGNVITVRMQNDAQLPIKERRYKDAFSGQYQIYKKEGLNALFKGTQGACSRAVFLTFGLNAIYDQIKEISLQKTNMEDGVPLHLLNSTIAGVLTTIITNPLDVVTTMYVNSKPGEMSGLLDATKYAMKLGPKAFYRGVVPMLCRVLPNNVLTFLIYEQMRLRIGWLPEDYSNFQMQKRCQK